jgi:hypothetical protein
MTMNCRFPMRRISVFQVLAAPSAELALSRVFLTGSRILLGLLCVVAMPLSAHSPMNHECAAPSRPINDQDDVSWQTFLSDIDAFQSCVSEAAERHQVASQAHQDAARDAVESWNQFVHSNLNVPEDFPFEPE